MNNILLLLIISNISLLFEKEPNCKCKRYYEEIKIEWKQSPEFPYFEYRQNQPLQISSPINQKCLNKKSKSFILDLFGTPTYLFDLKKDKISCFVYFMKGDNLWETIDTIRMKKEIKIWFNNKGKVYKIDENRLGNMVGELKYEDKYYLKDQKEREYNECLKYYNFLEENFNYVKVENYYNINRDSLFSKYANKEVKYPYGDYCFLYKKKKFIENILGEPTSRVSWNNSFGKAKSSYYYCTDKYCGQSSFLTYGDLYFHFDEKDNCIEYNEYKSYRTEYRKKQLKEYHKK